MNLRSTSPIFLSKLQTSSFPPQDLTEAGKKKSPKKCPGSPGGTLIQGARFQCFHTTCPVFSSQVLTTCFPGDLKKKRFLIIPGGNYQRFSERRICSSPVGDKCSCFSFAFASFFFFYMFSGTWLFALNPFHFHFLFFYFFF